MIKHGIEILLITAIILLSVFQKIEWYDSAILSMLSFIVVEIITQKMRHESLFTGVRSSISGVNIELKLIATDVQLKNIHDALKADIGRISHPYFIKQLSHRLEGFLQENASLFNGEYITSPFSTDTYGAEGLLSTKDNLKCISSFDDYWSDRGNSDYYDNQKKLVSNGVRIQRLFVIDDSNRDIANKEMERQKSDGFEVRSIEKYKFGEKGFFRDYLIQDNILLVDLIPNDFDNPKHGDSVEKISTNSVGERVDEFNQFWGLADKAITKKSS